MSALQSVWFGISNRNDAYSGTPAPITLTINDGGLADNVEFTLPSSPTRQAQALLAQTTTTGGLTPENMNASSVRVGIRGANRWIPENFIVWGTRYEQVIPLALETDLNLGLSTDCNEGHLSLNLRRITAGSATLPIKQLMMLMKTSELDNSGTTSRINLEITIAGGLRVNWQIPRTPQPPQETGGSNFYRIGGFSPAFTKNDLNDESIILRIKGDDSWRPTSFFLFGAYEENTRPSALVPLVHLPAWPYGAMSTDTSEGSEYLKLPLV